jgi:hypothetical protein
MKVLIQNPLTLSYFRAERKWTADPGEAWDFKDSRNAVRFCAEHNMLDHEIVLKFPDERYDVHMPAWAAAPQRMERATTESRRIGTGSQPSLASHFAA